MTNKIDPLDTARSAADVGSAVPGAVGQAAQSVQSLMGAASGLKDLAGAAWSLMTGESGTYGVEYTFHSDGDPSARYRVRSATGAESLSAVYSYTVELGTKHGDDPTQLLGKSCTLTLARKDYKRAVQGIVCSVERGARVHDFDIAEIVVVPALVALEHRHNTRIFQNKTVPEVLDLVLGSALQPFERKHRSDLRRAVYPKREYIVQHQESDLAFVQRLMAEEGIWYFFEHPEGSGAAHAELLVLADDNDAGPKAALGEADDVLPLHLNHGGGLDHEAVQELKGVAAIGTTSRTLRAFDWANPPVPALKAVPATGADHAPSYEADDVVFWDYQAPKFGKSDVDDQARLRSELGAVKAVRIEGSGNVIGLVPGQKVTVRKHPKGLDGTYLVVSVTGRGHYLQEGDSGDNAEDYANDFTCIPLDVPYRPARKPKPRVQGIQTGTVVGPDGKPDVPPSGDDIHTDEHGRIQVKLSWYRTTPGSRDPKDPATNTCFLRVAQTWGGSGWGFVFIPRIGMEVIVSFIDGDPDRPLVTGCVYNGLNRPHYTLPDEKTKSYIMTQSSPNGDGFNELCFEDAKGSEKIYVHAQKDYDEMVEHDHSTTVKRNQANTVKGSRTVSVGGNHSESVTGKQSVTVDKDRDITVKKNEKRTILGTETVEVTELDTETYHGGRKVTVEKSEVLETVAAHKNDKIDGQYNVTVKDHLKVIHGPDELFVTNVLYGNFTDKVEFKVGANSLTITKDGKISLHADTQITLSCGGGSLTIKSDGSVEASGSTKVALGSGSSSVTAEAAGVTVSGPKISSTAIGIHEIGGAMVKVG